MVEPYPPLLPWKVLGGVLLALAAWSGWTWSWDPFARLPVDALTTVAALPRRTGQGEAVLFLTNSRLGFPLHPSGTLPAILAEAGMPEAEVGMVVEPRLTFSMLFPAMTRLAAYHPSIVVVQLDLFFPIGRDFYLPRVANRLDSFEREGPDLAIGLEVVQHLGARRRIAVEVPLAEHVVEGLDPRWVEIRERSRKQLRDHGYEVVGDDSPWPDALFSDGVHLDPTGSARLVHWLGTQLRAR